MSESFTPFFCARFRCIEASLVEPKRDGIRGLGFRSVGIPYNLARLVISLQSLCAYESVTYQIWNA